VGGITETDASLAGQPSSAILVRFNVRADALARRISKLKKLDCVLLQHYL